MAKGNYEIPFDEKGNQLDYPGWGSINWRANHTFKDTLTYESYGRGRSAVTFTFARSDGRTVTMFVSDLDDVVRQMVGGKITGEFTFIKRGQNYGCRLVAAGEGAEVSH